MNKDSYIKISISVFALVGIIHLYRGFAGIPLTLGEYVAPIYVSYIESFIFFVLAYLGYRQR